MAISSSLATENKRSSFTGSFKKLWKNFPGNFGSPILQKELRGNFRKNGFFIIHTLCLTVIAGAIVWGVMSHSESATSTQEKLTSVQLGRSLFDTFFVIQYFIVLIIFPALTATAFTEERTRGSYDLLLCTDLNPSEIVLGKLLATSIYCLTTVFATLPLLAITTLFGGVSFGEIAAGYGILIGLTLALSMLGVFISAWVSSNIMSILIVYSVVFMFFIYSAMTWPYFVPLFDFLGIAKLEEGEIVKTGDTFVGMILKHIGGGKELLRLGFYSVITFAYFFIFTTNRIRPKADDHSSPLRALTLVFLACLAFLNWQDLSPEFANHKLAEEEVFSSSLILFFFLLFVVLRFSTESLMVPRRICRRFSRWRGIRFFYRIFTPGAFWGFVFTFVLILLGSLSFYSTLMPAIDDLDSWGKYRYTQFFTFFPFYFFGFAALGFCLSAWGFTPGYNFWTVFFIFIITALLPLIFSIGQQGDGIFCFYYISPFTIFQSLGEPPPMNEKAPRYLLFGSVPVIVAAGVFFTTVGTLLTWIGTLLARKAKAPMLCLGKWADEAKQDGV